MIKSLRRAFLRGAGGALGLVGAAGALGLAPRRPAMAGATPPASAGLALLTSYVAGAAYHGAAAELAELGPGTLLELRRDRANAYDPRSVEVRSPKGTRLGYVPRIDNQALANLMDAGLPVSARVSSLGGSRTRPEIRFEVRLLATG
jgi:HIRAN domain